MLLLKLHSSDFSDVFYSLESYSFFQINQNFLYSYFVVVGFGSKFSLPIHPRSGRHFCRMYYSY